MNSSKIVVKFFSKAYVLQSNKISTTVMLVIAIRVFMRVLNSLCPIHS